MDNKKHGQTKPYSGHGDVDQHGPYTGVVLVPVGYIAILGGM